MDLLYFFYLALQGRRLLNMYHRIFNLSNNLQELNLSLEKKVEERTLELSNSLQKRQNLHQFQEDMSNMIVHNLKEHLNQLVNIRSFMSSETQFDFIEESSQKMLNLVQNILGVYKYESAEIDLSIQKNKYGRLNCSSGSRI